MPVRNRKMNDAFKRDRHKRDISVIDFDPKDLKGKPLGEIPHKVVYICPKYRNEETPEPFREWMRAIEDSLDELVEESEYASPQIRRVFQQIEKDTVSPYDRAKMFDEYNQEELKRKTKEEGWREGREAGRQEGREETARNLLLIGKLTIEQIAEVTGLSPDRLKEISKIQDDLK